MKSSKKKAPKAAVKLIKTLLAPAAVVEIFKRLQRANPHPKTELNYANAYTLLVAVTLSAQMTDTGVNRATESLFKIADTPQKMLTLSEDKLIDYIKGVNFHRTKAKNVLKQAQMLTDRHGGAVPQDYDALVTLPGVGNKTAKVVLNEIFGEPTIAVDTHIFRVSQRLGLAYGLTPEEIEAGLHAIVPLKYQPHTHHWLLLHGRYICKARVPECWHCPLVDLCLYPDKNLVKPGK